MGGAPHAERGQRLAYPQAGLVPVLQQFLLPLLDRLLPPRRREVAGGALHAAGRQAGAAAGGTAAGVAGGLAGLGIAGIAVAVAAIAVIAVAITDDTTAAATSSSSTTTTTST